MNKLDTLSRVGFVTAIAVGLYLSSLYNYLLFHSLIEIVTVAIAFALFILAWNTRGYLTNNYLRLLGIGYVFIALIDLLHTLAFKGMNVFPGFDANLPTQLWIAARYLQAVTLLVAPFLVGRKVNDDAAFAGYAAAVSLFVAMIYSGNFPDCFIEGRGLTAFKIRSEYLISVLLIVALYLFYRKREYFDTPVFFLAASSIVCTVLSELSFTAYASVYGFANMVGHFAKLAAFYLIYRAILVTGLKEPFNLIFRDLKQAEEGLRKSNDILEEKVRERTEDLRRLNRELRAISSCNQLLMRAVDEQNLLENICNIVCDEADYRMAWVGFAENDESRTIRPVAWAGAETGYLEKEKLTWADTERGRGPSGTAIRTGATSCIQDFAADAQATPWRDEALLRGYRSSISLPLKDESANTFGIFNIYAAMPNAFTPEEIGLLEELAEDMAFGIRVLRARTGHKRAEEEIRKLNQELEQRVVVRTAELQAANKELEAFSYSVSHDLRAPLRHIDGFLDLLKARIAETLDDKSRHYMDTISDAAKRMGKLIDDLLAFSRMGRKEMAAEEVGLGALLQEVIMEFEPDTKGRDIDWRIGELPVVNGDRAMLRVVLVNLISNALKFTQKRAKAEIEIGCLPEQKAQTSVFVRDNGAGFDMQYADKLFGVFQRLHGSDEFEGTGIGLANVRRIISRHGGRTWAEGKVDEGASFYFSVPQVWRAQ